MRQGFPPRERSGPAGSRDRGPRGPGDRRPGDRDTRRRDDRGGGRGRGDRDSARRPERKLYSTDSVVDRGFEDVESDGETQRVYWSISKRTVADLISRKPLSATYVLQRDGQESDFPTLGLARTAVNKTILHPEKLTRSRAELAAEKK